MKTRQVSVLFARSDSVYKRIPGIDVWDADRDARLYDGCDPVICHPPCRAWGQLRRFANPAPGELNLARLSISLVRAYGGVVEHPASSRLWSEQTIGVPGQVDEHGGFLTFVDQFHFGHKVRKRTGLYIVGVFPKDLPPLPLDLGYPAHAIASRSGLPDISKAEREHTPLQFAYWLVTLARSVHLEHRAAS